MQKAKSTTTTAVAAALKIRPAGGESKESGAPERAHTMRVEARRGVGPIIVQGVSYKRVEYDVDFTSETYLICDGDSRESILINMHSTQLEELFQDYLHKLEISEADTQTDEDAPSNVVKSKITITQKPHELLQDLMNHMAEQFVGAVEKAVTEADIDRLIVAFNASQGNGDISKIDSLVPLGYFSKVKEDLLCRHKALLMAYLLTKVIHHIKNQKLSAGLKETKDSNQVYRYRADLQSAAGVDLRPAGHAVTVLQAENGHRYIIDLTRGTSKHRGVIIDITDLSNADVREKLARYYHPYNGVKFAEEMNVAYDQLRVAGPALRAAAP